MAAPLGNQNAAKAKVWTAAVERALSARSALDRKDALEACANALIDKAMEGDMTALKELGDRLEGKPAQAVSLSGELAHKHTLADVLGSISASATDNPSVA